MTKICALPVIMPDFPLSRQLPNYWKYLKKKEEEILPIVKEFFLSLGIAIDEIRTSGRSMFHNLAMTLKHQIIIIDECKSVFFFPLGPNNSPGQYDPSKPSLHLLKCRYPVVDEKTGAMLAGGKFYDHFHGLTSIGDFLALDKSSICLYCNEVFSLQWQGHVCNNRKRNRANLCLFCSRPRMIISKNDTICKHLLSERDLCVSFKGGESGGGSDCTQGSGSGNGSFKCQKCLVSCYNEDCLRRHSKVKKCRLMSKCKNCGQVFLCQGQLSPVKTAILDKKGDFTGEFTIDLPDAHVNCDHVYCRMCDRYVTHSSVDPHMCTLKTPWRAKKMPAGMGGLSLALSRENNELKIEGASVVYHRGKWTKDAYRRILFYDRPNCEDGGTSNLPRDLPGDSKLGQTNYLPPDILRESLRYSPGSKMAAKSKDPSVKKSWKEVEKRFSRPKACDEPVDGSEKKRKAASVDDAIVAEKSWLQFWQMYMFANDSSDPSEFIEIGDIEKYVAETNHEEKWQGCRPPYNFKVNAKERTIAQRLLTFFMLPLNDNFTYVCDFKTGYEASLLLKAAIEIGKNSSISCSFQGRKVTKMRFINGCVLTDINGYLPSSLFKITLDYGLSESWAFFPKREINPRNWGREWETVPDASWFNEEVMEHEMERTMLDNWRNNFKGRYNFDHQVASFLTSSCSLVLQIALLFTNECMAFENRILDVDDRRKGLLAGSEKVRAYDKLVYVSNNHPFSSEFPSMAAYYYWIFLRVCPVPLPIMQYQRKDNPASKSSKMELCYLQWLKHTRYEDLQFALNGGQKKLRTKSGREIFVDGYVPKKREGDEPIVIEILGCYYHDCRECFPAGSPFQNLCKASLINRDNARIEELKHSYKVVVVKSHEILQLRHADKEFRKFYKKFSSHDFDGFGWREGHSTGVAEPFGLFLDAEEWKNTLTRRDSITRREDRVPEPAVQIDMNSNYLSTLLSFPEDELHQHVFGDKQVPIPMGGHVCLFASQISNDVCPDSCWKSQCGSRKFDPNHKCTITGCQIVCNRHFGPQFFDNVSGMAKVTILAPQDLIYPVIGINVSTKLTGAFCATFYALCRTCAESAAECRYQEYGINNDTNPRMHVHDKTCENLIPLAVTPCSHTDQQRSFRKVLPLNELSYAISMGYKVLEYHCIRYFAINGYGLLEPLMREISDIKCSAKGGVTRKDDREDGDGGTRNEKNPVLAKIAKLAGCLIVGKLATVNDKKKTGPLQYLHPILQTFKKQNRGGDVLHAHQSTPFIGFCGIEGRGREECKKK